MPYVQFDNAGNIISTTESQTSLDEIKITNEERELVNSNQEKYKIENSSLKDIFDTEEYTALQNQKQKELRKKELLEEIDNLDKKRIRAFCEPSQREDGQFWLEYFTQKIQAKRIEFTQLA